MPLESPVEGCRVSKGTQTRRRFRTFENFGGVCVHFSVSSFTSLRASFNRAKLGFVSGERISSKLLLASSAFHEDKASCTGVLRAIKASLAQDSQDRK